jgi:hypothetical protein
LYVYRTSDNNNPGEKKKGEGVEQEREQLWDSMMSGVMDAMKPWEQREWQVEERLAEEHEAQWGSSSQLRLTVRVGILQHGTCMWSK